MKAIVESLEVKIKKLISLHDKIKQERETAINEVVEIRKDLMEKQEDGEWLIGGCILSKAESDEI